MKNFRTYQLAKEFHLMVEQIEWRAYLRDQALRASSSVVLNIAEGAGLPSKRLKSRHYNIALGSLREVQAALDISRADTSKSEKLADVLAAHLFQLCKSVAS